MEPPHNIIIVGAGIAGIACALALSRELTPFVPDLKITVFERHGVLSTSGGAINLTPVAQRHLAQLGVLEELDRMGSEGGATIDPIELFSMRSGRSVGSIDFTGQCGNGFGGYKGRRVMRIVLSMAMMAVVERSSNVDVVFGKNVASGEEINDKAVVHFQDGSEAIGDLVIGCDGVHSAVRTRWVDPSRATEYTGISFVQATMDSDSLSLRPHFCSSALNISRHGSILTSFSDRDREQVFACAMVQFSPEALRCHRLEPGQDWMTQNRARCALRGELKHRFGKCAIPYIREIIDSEAEWMLYPVYQVRPGGRWCINRVVLLGDAAHAMPPRDESAAYALDDAIIFARTLGRYHLEPLARAFGAYERLRRSTINHAFKESCRLWDRSRDMGILEGRLKEWMLPFYLRSHRDERDAAWEFDAMKIAIPELEGDEDLVTLHSFLKECAL